MYVSQYNSLPILTFKRICKCNSDSECLVQCLSNSLFTYQPDNFCPLFINIYVVFVIYSELNFLHFSSVIVTTDIKDVMHIF